MAELPLPGEVWESDDNVRRTIVMPAVLLARLAASAERRDMSVSDLLVEFAEAGLRREEQRCQEQGD